MTVDRLSLSSQALGLVRGGTGPSAAQSTEEHDPKASARERTGADRVTLSAEARNLFRQEGRAVERSGPDLPGVDGHVNQDAQRTETIPHPPAAEGDQLPRRGVRLAIRV